MGLNNYALKIGTIENHGNTKITETVIFKRESS